MRNWTSRDKLKFIHALDKDKLNKYKLILDKSKNIKDVLDFIPIILNLIQRIGKEEEDTIFMNKIDLLKFAYNIFIKFIFDMLEYTEKTPDEAKVNIKPITNALFCKHDHISNFFLYLIESYKEQKNKSGVKYWKIIIIMKKMKN